MTIRAVADPNVLVAAAISPRGTCGQLVIAAAAQRWRPVGCPHLWSELSDVLTRGKFRRWMTLGEADEFVATMTAISESMSDPELPATPVTDDPDDEYLAALAVHSDVDALVSGDHHLTDLVNFQPPVMTPARFLELLDAPQP